MSPLMLGEASVVFVNRLTGDGKYPLQDYENLQLPIQMQLSEKGKKFFGLFVPFLWEFATPNSNVIISKTKKFFSIFCSFSRIYIKF